MPAILALRSFLSFFVLFATVVCGQYINGQTFTNGLSIIDSPSPQNPGHAGSPMPIAVDVSGDGKLQSAAGVPGSGLSTRYDALEIYLVSAQTNINMTVSATPDFLTGESGSTVKHLNWPIATCLPAGNYNLTFYEMSHFNSQPVFTITPIPVPISNTSPSGPCNASILNPLQTQPQQDNPLTQSPFAPNSSLPAASTSASSTSASPPGIASASGSVLLFAFSLYFLCAW